MELRYFAAFELGHQDSVWNRASRAGSWGAYMIESCRLTYLGAYMASL